MPLTMHPATPGELCGLAVSALLLIAVLVVCYGALLAYRPPRPAPAGKGGRQAFCPGAAAPGPATATTLADGPPTPYAPACGNCGGRFRCAGLTAGAMPAIDTEWGAPGYSTGCARLCCGAGPWN